ncbi:ATP-dependent DNA helicase 2 subunit KU80-like isoform X2 [Punica granatum]|uniref:ATP-dependent DNA helicase 2 subunit KU80-like isoform X2 n=1 Tax=Punica granatum TaxID=22663 RepID=A0A6P8E2Z8_PUNGR|nr:ATP-dependent DNA helicase 2 subunit KU80-like isoform X2 [Punica granatum]
MARNREALVWLLDVGPSVHHLLPEVEHVCSMIVQNKLLHKENDEVGVVLFGTEETENEDAKEVGGYEHVFVSHSIQVVNGDVLETLQHLPRGPVSGDFLDAIVVGTSMLIKKFGPLYPGRKKLYLITDASSPIKGSHGGSQEEQVKNLAAAMSSSGIKLESIVARGISGSDADEMVIVKNDRILNLLSRITCAKMTYVESPTSLLGAIRIRDKFPGTIFRGDLEISSQLKIKVRVYKKTLEEKFPTLKRFCDEASHPDELCGVKVKHQFKSFGDDGQIVPSSHEVTNGYLYGPQVVDISSSQMNAVKFKPEKGVKLLGFTDSSNIMRHHYMTDVRLFIAEPGDTEATIAISALARAMKRMNKVAILRCVWRKGQANVVIGVLTPNVSDDDNMPDSFYFNALPFFEDLREFKFLSFCNLSASLQPSEEQQRAADELVEVLDLGPSDHQEELAPDFTPNPVLQLKVKNPDAAVPPLSGALRRITEPDPEFLSRIEAIIEAFMRKFGVREWHIHG